MKNTVHFEALFDEVPCFIVVINNNIIIIIIIIIEFLTSQL